jgi:2-methylisocitrate lyase-like PEP mutase family enzyme
LRFFRKATATWWVPVFGVTVQPRPEESAGDEWGVGTNLEDGLAPVDRHAAKIAAVKSAAPGLFVTARTDTYWLGDGEGTRQRLDAYREAGADGLFVPGLADPAEIASLVRHLADTPLNILCTPNGPAVPHLTDLGVRRISLGSLLYRRALGAALETVADIRAGRVPRGAVPSYAEVEALNGRPRPASR